MWGALWQARGRHGHVQLTNSSECQQSTYDSDTDRLDSNPAPANHYLYDLGYVSQSLGILVSHP